MDSGTSRSAPDEAPKPIEQAAARTAQIQEDLAVVEAELNLTNAILGDAWPDAGENEDDVKKAVRQNAAIEEKVGEAAEELQEVTDLLHEEISQRQRLERELERRAAS